VHIIKYLKHTHYAFELRYIGNDVTSFESVNSLITYSEDNQSIENENLDNIIKQFNKPYKK